MNVIYAIGIFAAVYGTRLGFQTPGGTPPHKKLTQYPLDFTEVDISYQQTATMFWALALA